ncbi:MAG: hypothetical protein JNG88_06725 [Phycisphaerales bacterium]|nr:hypothetical protein [Phycisphaerales bacterium]
MHGASLLLVACCAALCAGGCGADLSQLSDEERATILANGATNTTVGLLNVAYTSTIGAALNRAISNAFNNLFDIKPILR